MIFKQMNNSLLKKVNQTSENAIKNKCNCKHKEKCPLDGNCLQPTVTYEGTVKTETDEYPYIGITEGPFKSRLNDHTKTFRNIRYEKSTEISKKVWELKQKNQKFDISWKILEKTHPYKIGGKNCNLCLSEKYHILTSTSKNLLNSKSEIISKCRHMNKFLLKNNLGT